MPISYSLLTNKSVATGVTSITTSAFTPANNSMLIAYVAGGTSWNKFIPSLSGGGLTWTYIGKCASRYTAFVYAYRASVTTGASMTVATSGVTSALGMSIAIYQVTGHSETYPIGSFMFTTGLSRSGSYSISMPSTVSPSSLVLYALSAWNSTSTSPGTGWTENATYNIDTGQGLFVRQRYMSQMGAQNLTCNLLEGSGLQYSVAGIEINDASFTPAAAGGSGYININGVWTKINRLHINVGGVWYGVRGTYVKDGGAWHSMQAPADPGSVTYTAPGEYSFIIPNYNSLQVELWGGGGGGGGISMDGGGGVFRTAGSTGTPSRWQDGASFGNPEAGSGAGGSGSLTDTTPAVGGTASGGDINTSGNPALVTPDAFSTPARAATGGSSPNGGGNAVMYASAYYNLSNAKNGFDGLAPGGGGSGAANYSANNGRNVGNGGGGGAYCKETYARGAYSPGQVVRLTVGDGGNWGWLPSSGDRQKAYGGWGAPGQVKITWS
jgi:hypothetical protein